ncbi:MAG: DNA translocase FtsK [Helicobacter sp.]|nr:DNA translocase FtsK [Helicobacter sp.]
MAQDSQILEKESLEIKLVPLKDSQKPVSNFIPINPQDTIHRLKKIEEALHERRSKDTSDDLKLIPKTKLQEEQKYQIEASQTFYQYESFTQPHEEQKNIKPIKSYPKDLYSPKPFSSYLENEPQEPTPAINEDSTLPNTIFYYTKKDTQTTQKTLEDESKDNLQEADLNPNEDIISPSQENGEISPSNAYAKPIEPQQEEPQSSATIHYYTNFNSPIQQEIPFYGFPAYHESIHESTTAKTQPPTQNISPIQDIQSTQTTTQISHEIPALSNTSYAQQTPNLSQDSNMYIPTTPKSSVQTQVKILEENQKLLKEIEYDPNHKHKGQNFILPKLEFLQLPQEERIEINEEEIDKKINDLLGKLRMFKIEGDIVRTYSGPIVTTFEFRPSPNVKVSRILTLQDDLAMALRAKTIRIQAPIPGKDVVGIEIPNHQIQTIYLREILENNLFQNSTSPLTLALGKDIVGNPFITDLKKLPHLLIAGTTGSGKSVGINAMILSLLYKNTPDQLKLIMIDPKMLEFSIYNDIPHLLTPVITQPKKAIIALDNTVKEMERRYTLMSEVRTKNIEGYNQKALNEGFEPFPYIVVIIDELADLMMSGGKEAELSISRLAQMARASGIHLIVATQRPSVDVVTGIIKANLPSRISYKVGQKIDSKVILDSFGAESLLGRGDMLFTPPSGGIVRLHAPWSTEHEIEEIVNFIKSQGSTNYDENFMPSEDENLGMRYEVETDELYEEAKRIILNDRKTSISYIQRRLGIGYNKAANIIEQMQTKGFLSEPNPKGVREILGE